MKEILFRVTAGVAAVYHLALGGVLLVLPADALHGMAKLFLGIAIEFDAKMVLAGKFASGYILAFGIVLALLCWKPVQLRVLVVPVLVLFGIRLANKLVLMTTIEGALGVGRGRSLFALASLLLIFGLLAWARPMGEKSQGS